MSKTCPCCRKENNKFNNFCTHCCNKLVDTHEEEHERDMLIIGMIFIVIIVLWVMGVGL